METAKKELAEASNPAEKKQKKAALNKAEKELAQKNKALETKRSRLAVLKKTDLPAAMAEESKAKDILQASQNALAADKKVLADLKLALAAEEKKVASESNVLRNKIAKNKSDLSAIQAQLTELSGQLVALKNQEKTLEVKRSNSAALAASLAAESEANKSKLVSNRDAIDSLKLKKDAASTELLTVKTDLKALTPKIAASRQSLQDLRAKVADRQQTVVAREEALAKTSQELAAVNGQIKELTMAIQKNTDAIAKMKAEVVATNNLIISSEAKIEELKLQLKELKKEETRVAGRKTDVEAVIAGLNDQLSAEGDKLAKLEQVGNAYQKDLRRLSVQRKPLRQEAQNRFAQYSAVQDKVRAKRQQMVALRQSIVGQNEIIANLNSDLQNLIQVKQQLNFDKRAEQDKLSQPSGLYDQLASKEQDIVWDKNEIIRIQGLISNQQAVVATANADYNTQKNIANTEYTKWQNLESEFRSRRQRYDNEREAAIVAGKSHGSSIADKNAAPLGSAAGSPVGKNQGQTDGSSVGVLLGAKRDYDFGYDRGVGAGFDRGEKIGKSNGTEAGLKDGVKEKGRIDGYNKGLADGRKQGYTQPAFDQGYEVGYKLGVNDAKEKARAEVYPVAYENAKNAYLASEPEERTVINNETGEVISEEEGSTDFGGDDQLGRVARVFAHDGPSQFSVSRGAEAWMNGTADSADGRFVRRANATSLTDERGRYNPPSTGYSNIKNCSSRGAPSFTVDPGAIKDTYDYAEFSQLYRKSYDDNYKGSFPVAYRSGYRSACDQSYASQYGLAKADSLKTSHPVQDSRGFADGDLDGYDTAYQPSYNKAYGLAYEKGRAAQTELIEEYRSSYDAGWPNGYDPGLIEGNRQGKAKAIQDGKIKGRKEGFDKNYTRISEESKQEAKLNVSRDYAQIQSPSLVSVSIKGLKQGSLVQHGQSIELNLTLRNYGGLNIDAGDLEVQVTDLSLGLDKQPEAKKLLGVDAYNEVKFTNIVSMKSIAGYEGKKLKLKVKVLSKGRLVGEQVIEYLIAPAKVLLANSGFDKTPLPTPQNVNVWSLERYIFITSKSGVQPETGYSVRVRSLDSNIVFSELGQYKFGWLKLSQGYQTFRYTKTFFKAARYRLPRGINEVDLLVEIVDKDGFLQFRDVHKSKFEVK